MNSASELSSVMRIIIGVALLVVGILLLVNIFDARVPAFWLSALITLVGVFTVTSAPMVGMALMGIGVYMLLRDFGVVYTPWVGIGFGLFLTAVGVYGIFGGVRQKKHVGSPEASVNETDV